MAAHQLRRNLTTAQAAACHPLSALFGGPPPWIFGVLNCTPDSFSDGGKFATPESALVAAREMRNQGAHAIDIGGESTRPGGDTVPAAEELRRIEPVVTSLAAEIPLSIDTYPAEVAERCLALGAAIINDVSAMRADPRMAAVCAEHRAYVVLMYSKESGDRPHASDRPRAYRSISDEIASELLRRVDAALDAGIKEDRLILDPGMGRFISCEPDDSWALLRHMARFVELVAPLPVMICTSRKGFLGGRLADRDPVSQLTALAALEQGVSAVRTHHVPMLRSFIDAAHRLG